MVSGRIILLAPALSTFQTEKSSISGSVGYSLTGRINCARHFVYINSILRTALEASSTCSALQIGNRLRPSPQSSHGWPRSLPPLPASEDHLLQGWLGDG